MSTEQTSHHSPCLDTLAVHAGREDFAALGVHAPPLDLSTTYPLGELGSGGASLESLCAGGPMLGNPVYSRLHNPTVARFESGLAQLEGAGEAVAFASGMAALTACLLVAKQRGEQILAVRPLYGTSDHLLASGLLGLDVRFVTAAQVAGAVTSSTSLVIAETPANPTLDLLDIEALVSAAGDVPVLIDNTFATPVLQNPLTHGARLVLHSATKFLGGHSDVLAGAIATDSVWAAALRQVRIATGAVLHPLAGYLLHRGLATLPLRVRRAQDSARHLATRLAAHPAIQRVLYPGLPGGDNQGILGRQMRGPGAILGFVIDGGMEAAESLVAALRLITPAVSLGSTDTLIQHPAALTHRIVDPGARASAGIDNGLLRLAVGLEDPGDLWKDLEKGLRPSATEKRGERRLAEAITAPEQQHSRH